MLNELESLPELGEQEGYRETTPALMRDVKNLERLRATNNFANPKNYETGTTLNWMNVILRFCEGHVKVLATCHCDNLPPQRMPSHIRLRRHGAHLTFVRGGL